MFSMFALGNTLFACCVHSACERSFEEARGETEIGRCLLALELHPLPPLSPWTRLPVRKSNPQLEPATSAEQQELSSFRQNNAR